MQALGQLAVDIQDNLALQSLSPLSGSFLPWTVAAMRPPAILAIVNDIVVRRRSTIVECGSGNSTLFAARALAQHQIAGHVHSIDHHPDWANLTTAAIARDGLEQLASVTCAPLRDGWYDRRLLPTVKNIGLLVVDGPPAYSPTIARARLSALDHFIPSLAPGATIVLDDSWRKGERAVMAAWQARHGVRLLHQRGGYAIGTYQASDPET